MLLPKLGIASSSPDPTRVPGPRNDIRIGSTPIQEIPRIEGVEIELDGVLDESVWDQATVFSGFSDYLPIDGRPAQDSTVVLAWYSPTAIHFWIRAY